MAVVKTRTEQTYPDLLAWREARGLSQQEAADLLHISKPKYNRLERQTRFLRGPEAKRLTRKTGVPLDVLVGAH